MTVPAEGKMTIIDREEVVDAPSVTRTSIAYARNDDLVLTEYAADTPRYRFSASGEFLGVLIEEEQYQSAILDSEDYAADGWDHRPVTTQNFALQSEDLDESGTWVQSAILSVADSGVPAPTIEGASFGNYWKITPSTASANHNLDQDISSPAGKFSFLLRDGGYDYCRFNIFDLSDSFLAGATINTVTGEITNSSISEMSAIDVGSGDWLVVGLEPSGLPVGRILFQPRESAGVGFFAGNGTDGILVTRVQVSEQGAEYAKTTTAIVNNTVIDTLDITGSVDGPDDATNSATTIDTTGGLGVEYLDAAIGTTTFTWASAVKWSASALSIGSYGDIPTVRTTGPQFLQTGATDQDISVPTHALGDGLYLIVTQNSVESVPDLSADGYELVVNVASGSTSYSRLLIYVRRALSASEPDVTMPGLTSSVAVRVRVARFVVVENADVLYTNSETGGSADVANTSGIVPAIDGERTPAILMLFCACYAGTFNSVDTSGWTNADVDNITILVDGLGSNQGAGAGLAITTGDLTPVGVINDTNARMSTFFQKSSGSGTTVTLYNAHGTEEATFDASTGDVISGDGQSEVYVNGFLRLSMGIQDATTPIGFGVSFDGEMNLFGSNLMAGYGPYEYMIDDTLFTGDVLVPYTGASLIYSNIPEPDTYDAGPNGAAVIWEAGTYNTGDRAIDDDHMVYQVSAEPSTTDKPSVGALESPPTWVRVGPSNRWKMFIVSASNGVAQESTVFSSSIASVQADFIEVLLAPEAGNYIPSYCLHGLDAGVLTETIYNGETVVSEREISLVSNAGVNDWWDYWTLERAYISQYFSGELEWNADFRLKLNISGGETVTVGKCIIGDPKDAGVTIDSIEISDRTFGRQERNEFGDFIYSRGRSIDTKTYRVWIEQDRKSYVEQQLRNIGTEPTTYIGYMPDELSITYGTRKSRRLTYNLFDARTTIQVETV